jgi:3-hydroxymyristoyl/3-hydroxydecanoyl-(acyl carrier protein) dehydratase
MTDINETVVERGENLAVLDFSPKSDWDYFDGHFPAFKLLPAVAQAEIAVRMADKYFATGILSNGAKRLKFSAIIQPDTLVRLHLQYNADKKSIAFKMASPDETITYSSGTLLLLGNV